jgi:hypothetical protein
MRAKARRYADWLQKKCGGVRPARRLARDLHRACGTPDDLAFFKEVIRLLDAAAEQTEAQ